LAKVTQKGTRQEKQKSLAGAKAQAADGISRIGKTEVIYMVGYREQLLLKLRHTAAQLKDICKKWTHMVEMNNNGSKIVKYDVSGLDIEEIRILMSVISDNYCFEVQGGKVYAIVEESKVSKL
jgi:hypothetical protein